MNAPVSVPDAEALRRQLADLGDGLQAQCHELHKAPTPDRCERVAVNLEGARRAVMTLRERLLAEGEGRGNGP